MASAVKVVGVLNGKGGVGKTTTAINLAATLAETYTVLLVDTDPQGSASWWTGRSEKGMGFDISQDTDPKSLQRLKDIQQYEIVVVDTPPYLNSESLGAIAPVANYLLLPTPPAPMDLMALIETVRTLVKPTDVNYRVLLTRVDPRSTGVAVEAQETLRSLNIPVCNTYVRAYKAHEQAALEGVAITQWRGRNATAAQSDYRSVADELQQDWRH
ncbi:MAG: ParA family protein [Leptolyngbyaceae cyanobacterium]